MARNVHLVYTSDFIFTIGILEKYLILDLYNNKKCDSHQDVENLFWYNTQYEIIHLHWMKTRNMIQKHLERLGWEISGFCLLSFCQNERFLILYIFEKVVFIFQFLSSPIACVACERTELLKTEIHGGFLGGGFSPSKLLSIQISYFGT